MINFYLVVVSTLPRILFLLKQIFHLFFFTFLFHVQYSHFIYRSFFYTFTAINFCLRPIFAASHTFWYIVFSFLSISRYFLIFLVIFFFWPIS